MAEQLFKPVIDGYLDEFRSQHRRLVAAIRQLDDDDLNWRPNEQSNSITNLVLHIRGNIGEWVESALGGGAYQRDRDREFNTRERYTRDQLIAMVDEGFQAVERIVSGLGEPDLLKPVSSLNWRDGQATVLQVLHHCLTHYAEHLGQVMYIAKLRLGDRYAYLSVPPPGGRKADI